MDKWFRDPRFGQRCLDAFRNSKIRRDGYFDNEFVESLLRAQIEGRSNYGFHLWTVMNAVFWHERWIGG